MEILGLPGGDLGAMCYLVKEGESALLIDPSATPEEMRRALGAPLPPISAILLTHGHFDHILALDAWRRETKAPVFVGKGDGGCLTDAALNGSSLFTGGGGMTFSPADGTLDGGEIRGLPLSVTVIPTPGHTAGSVCYLVGDALFTGDTLFAHGGVGRTDLPGGSFDAQRASLKSLLSGEDHPIYPGHGPASTLGAERRHHLFLL